MHRGSLPRFLLGLAYPRPRKARSAISSAVILHAPDVLEAYLAFIADEICVFCGEL